MSEAFPVNPTIPEDLSRLETVPDRYALPFVWGSWHITDGAVANYGIIPLVPTPPPEEVKNHQVDRAIYTRVTLCTPDEIGLTGLDVGMMGLGVEMTRNELHYAAAFGGTADEIADINLQEFLKQVSEHEGHEVGPDDMTDSQGVPLRESARQMMPQHLIHDLVNERLQSAITDATRDFSLGKIEGAFYRGLRQYGVLTLLGLTGLTLVEISTGGGHLTALDAGLNLGAGGASGFLALKHIRKHVTGTPDRYQSIQRYAWSLSQLVTHDIHAAHCRHLLDSQMGEANGLDEE